MKRFFICIFLKTTKGTGVNIFCKKVLPIDETLSYFSPEI